MKSMVLITSLQNAVLGCLHIFVLLMGDSMFHQAQLIAGESMNSTIITDAAFQAKFKKIKKGLNQEDTLKMLGAPTKKASDTWFYQSNNAPTGGQQLFSYAIVFANGKISSTSVTAGPDATDSIAPMSKSSQKLSLEIVFDDLFSKEAEANNLKFTTAYVYVDYKLSAKILLKNQPTKASIHTEIPMQSFGISVGFDSQEIRHQVLNIVPKDGTTFHISENGLLRHFKLRQR